MILKDAQISEIGSQADVSPGLNECQLSGSARDRSNGRNWARSRHAPISPAAPGLLEARKLQQRAVISALRNAMWIAQRFRRVPSR
jgi:hypothetical protein